MTNNAINTNIPIEVSKGGTANTTFTAYSVVCAGTTATGAFQNVSGVGTAGQVLKSNGAGALPTWQSDSSSGGFTSVVVQTFTADGTYTPTSGMSYCIIEVQAGGAGGGSTPTTVVGGGGGGGEYRRGVFSAATIGASQAVTVGAGGGGSAAGGVSSVGALISANGGSPGGEASSYGPPGAGGSGGTGGDFSIPGGPGGSGSTFSLGVSNASATSGVGGNSFFGSGAYSPVLISPISSDANGVNASNYGAGGSGALSAIGPATGGSGSQGIVIITEFIA